MGFIMDQMIKYIIGVITKVFDIYFYGTFAMLGVNLSIFEHVFPVVKKLEIAILVIAIGIAFFIFCFQLTKTFQPSEASEAEAPLSLLTSFIVALFYIIAYRPILNILIDFTSNAMTVMGTKNLKSIFSKGLASNMYSSIKDSLVKADNKNFLDGIKDSFDSLIGNQIPQMIVSLIVVIYLFIKLYKLSIIVIKNYVGIGILTYLAPLPMATRASQSTKSYMTSFLQLYIEHLLSVLLNLWFVRIIFGGFAAIDFASFSKMTDSLKSSGIQSAIGDAMNFGGANIAVFVAILIWAFMIGAFIDYALSLNYYIERLGGIGGLTTVSNKNNNQGTMSRFKNLAMGMGTQMAGRAIVDSVKTNVLGGKKVSTTDKSMGGKGESYQNMNKNADFKDQSPNNTESKESNRSGNEHNEAMGARNKNATMDPKQPKEKDFSPAADISKEAGGDALLKKKMNGAEAKKNLAAALKGKVLDPNKEGKNYLDKKMEGATGKEKNRLKDSLVFDTGKDGKQILSDITSDGKGSIHAELNGENVQLQSESAIKSSFSSDADATAYMNKCGNMEIGGQKLYYDPNQSPQFHRMMGNIDFGSESGIVEPYDPTKGSSFETNQSNNMNPPDPMQGRSRNQSNNMNPSDPMQGRSRNQSNNMNPSDPMQGRSRNQSNNMNPSDPMQGRPYSSSDEIDNIVPDNDEISF